MLLNYGICCKEDIWVEHYLTLSNKSHWLHIRYFIHLLRSWPGKWRLFWKWYLTTGAAVQHSLYWVLYCDSILRLTETQSILLQTWPQSQEWILEEFGTPGISLPLNLCREMKSLHSHTLTNEGVCQTSKQLATEHIFILHRAGEPAHSTGKS